MKDSTKKLNLIFPVILTFAALSVACSGLDTSNYSQNQNTAAAPTPSATPAPTPQVAPTPAPPPSVSATTGAQTWHNVGIVDGGTGDYGNLFYSPAGDLYVVYSTTPSPSEPLEVQIRPFGSAIFGPANQIAASGRTSNMYFQDNNTMWLASEDNANVNVYQSTNGGAAYALQQTYSAVGPGAATGFFNTQFLMNGTNLTLYYGYGYQTPGGERFTLKQSTYTAGAWSTTPSLFSSPATFLGSILYNLASNTFVLGSYGVYQSTNGGTSYTQALSSGTAAQNLLGVNTIAQRTTDGSLFAANNYVLGAAPSNQNWQVWQSTNFGNTWNNVVVYNSVLVFTQTTTAAIGNLIVSLAMVNNNQIYSMISYDGGATWNLPTLLVDLSATTNIIRQMNLTTSSTNIGLIYSMEDGSNNRLGVYLEELY